jgi:nitrogen-specific signal transduction histidine kinase
VFDLIRGHGSNARAILCALDLAENQGFKINLERSFDPAAGQVDVYPQEITRALLNLISTASMRRPSAKSRIVAMASSLLLQLRQRISATAYRLGFANL